MDNAINYESDQIIKQLRKKYRDHVRIDHTYDEKPIEEAIKNCCIIHVKGIIKILDNLYKDSNGPGIGNIVAQREIYRLALRKLKSKFNF